MANTSNIKILHRRVLTVQVEVWHTLIIRTASLREVRNILLQRNSDSRIRHAAESACARDIGIVESVGNVKAVKSRRSGEQVGVSLVVVRLVEVEGVAREN